MAHRWTQERANSPISGFLKPSPTRWYGRGVPEEQQLVSYQCRNFGSSSGLHLYLLSMPIAYSRHAPSTFDSRPVLKVAHLMPQRLRVVVK